MKRDNKKRVFMVSYGGGHANIIRCVYEGLSQNTEIQVIILALTTAPILYETYNIPYLTVSDVAKKLKYYSEIVKLGESLGRKFHNENLGLKLEDTIAYYGIGYCDLVEKYDYEKADSLFKANGRKSFLPIRTMKEILALLSPDIVVVTNAPRMEQATGIAANILNIPVVRINDLPIMDNIYFDCCLCVMNDWAKQYAAKNLKIDLAKIIVTGQPVFEEELKMDAEYLSIFRKELLGKKYKKIIVFFTRNGKNEKQEILALEKIAKKYADYLFVLKMHPNQDVNDLYQVSVENIIFEKRDAKLFVNICDIGITAFSTTGLEAVLLDKPLIVVNFDNEKYPVDYVQMGIAVVARTEKELEERILECLDKTTESFTQIKKNRVLFKNKENAVENICNVVLERMKD